VTELALGTAQFGSGYGVTNVHGRLSDDEVEAILRLAQRRGVTLLDTAAGYQDAEVRLGGAGLAAQTRVVTKFSLPEEDRTPTAEGLFADSIGRIGVEQLHGVLAHRMDDLSDPRFDRALSLLREARDAGRIARLGVSVYDRDDLDRALQVMPDLSIVQLPASVVDRRLSDDPLVASLRADGVEIHVRSAFLQGLLLTPRESIADRFRAIEPAIGALDDLAEQQAVTRMRLVLAHLQSHPAIDAVVVGATSARELEQIIDAWDGAEVAPIEGLPVVPSDILDPRRWSV
jgi:aryl-alcohol dehydrogenase-like predicted oxidoreductase